MKRILIFIGLKIKEISFYLAAFLVCVAVVVGIFVGSAYLAVLITSDYEARKFLTAIFIVAISGGGGLLIYRKELMKWLSDNWQEAGKIAGRLIIVLALLGMVGCSAPYIKVDSCEDLVEIAKKNKLYGEGAILCQYQAAKVLGMEGKFFDLTNSWIKLQIKNLKMRRGQPENEKKNSNDPVI